jgi:acetyl-CoA carboxylase biotin carboxyl carrier protein
MAPQQEEANDDALTRLRAQTLRLAGDLPGALRRLSVRSGDAVIDVEWQDGDVAPTVIVPVAEADENRNMGEVPAEERRSTVVRSPMVGTVYHAPSPDQPPFVTVGDVVEPGQTVVMVEAMKLFNPIVSEDAGVVLEVLVANGESVEYDQPLVRLKTSAEAGADVH